MSTQQVLFLSSPLLLGLLLTASFFAGYYATTLTCPEYLSENAVEKVNCSVNTTYYESSCLVYPTKVEFFFENALHTPILLCSASYNDKCDEEPVGEMNCSCVESDDDVNIYQLNFLGNNTVYEGGLTCKVDCYSPTATVSFILYCGSLKYNASLTSDTTATTVETVFYKTTEQETAGCLSRPINNNN